MLQRTVPFGRLARVDGFIASLTLAVGIGGNASGSLLTGVVPLPATLLAAAAVPVAVGLVAVLRYRAPVNDGPPPVTAPPVPALAAATSEPA